MKSPKKFFKGVTDNIDPDKIENYYGHGAQNHEQHDHSHNNDNKNKLAIKYRCPMNCEGNKVYDSPGICPVCNMKLKSVDNKNQ